jgi:hypothetical protein
MKVCSDEDSLYDNELRGTLEGDAYWRIPFSCSDALFASGLKGVTRVLVSLWPLAGSDRRSSLTFVDLYNEKTDLFLQVGFRFFFRTACRSKLRESDNLLIDMVGGAGFEPATLAV